MEFLLNYTQEVITSLGIHSLFWQMIIFGCLVTLPIGPWSIVALEQTHKHSTKHGLKIAICATLGDITIASIAFIFFRNIHKFLITHEGSIYTFSAVMLILFGIVFLLGTRKGSSNSNIANALHSMLETIGFSQKSVDVIINKILLHRRFLYVFTFCWSSLHPGNVLTYIMLCVILQSLGSNLVEASYLSEFLLPLFIATAFMWCGWVFVGRYICQHIYILKRGFGAVFILVGLQIFATHFF